jgi:hypothetical protein
MRSDALRPQRTLSDFGLALSIPPGAFTIYALSRFVLPDLLSLPWAISLAALIFVPVAALSVKGRKSDSQR